MANQFAMKINKAVIVSVDRKEERVFDLMVLSLKSNKVYGRDAEKSSL